MMKTPQSLKLMHGGLLLVFLTILFSGCLKDKCLSTYTYKIYKPVYITYDDLRSSVVTTPASEIINAGRIYYKSPYIFINELNKGIHVFDNSNPSSPQNISFINIPGNLDLAIKDNILYADSYIDLVAIDISSPANAVEVDREENVFPQRIYEGGWMGADDIGVITDWIEGDTTVTEDCNYNWNGGPMMFENSFNGGGVALNSTGGSGGGSNLVSPGLGVGGSMARFAIVQNYLYCLASLQMKLFDISSVSNPAQGAVVSMPWNIETIFPYNNYLFIGTTSGVSIYDNNNPAAPTYLAEFSHVTSCDPVVVQGNYAYSTLRSGTTCMGYTNQLDIIDISSIANPTLATSYQMTSPYGLGIDGENLFICDGAAGLKYYKISDPFSMPLQSTVSLGETRDVIPLGGLLIVVTTTGFYEFDYSSGTLQELSFVAF